MVFVSHDRYFIDKLATRVFEIGGGEVRVFPGNYEDYLWRKEGEASGAYPSSNGAAPEPAPEPVLSTKQKRLNPMKLKRLQDRATELEERIASLERRSPNKSCHYPTTTRPKNRSERPINLSNAARR